MRTTFFGIEMARRAILSQQQKMDIAGHNIANANSPGYSRQRGILRATNPLAAPGFDRPAYPGQYGTGVAMGTVQRMHDAFIQAQLNQEIQTDGRWNARREALSQLEMILLEPSDTGIRSAMDQFWESLQDLSKEPENMATRTVVRERAADLADVIRHARNRMDPLREDLEQSIISEVDRLNALGREVAGLNRRIGQVLSAGDQPNDLLDRRDALIKEASQLAGIQTVDRPNGQVAVLIGGIALVDGDISKSMRVDQTTGAVEWADTGRGVSFRDGRLRGLIEGRDEIVPAYMADLDAMAQELIDEINTRHQAGFDLNSPPAPGGLIFLGTDATDIRFNDALTEDLIAAASAPGNPGDGSNALAMAQLRTTPIGALGNVTLNSFFGSKVARLGVEGQEADRNIEQQQVLLGQLEGMRDSVSGVSLDEEMANLIQHQHAYNAAARMLTTADEALDVIINRMGLVGR